MTEVYINMHVMLERTAFNYSNIEKVEHFGLFLSVPSYVRTSVLLKHFKAMLFKFHMDSSSKTADPYFFMSE